MNTSNVLRKCIDALKESKPDISYIRGMLETLFELSAEKIPLDRAFPMQQTGTNIIYPQIKSDEKETIPDFLKPGPIGRINT